MSITRQQRMPVLLSTALLIMMWAFIQPQNTPAQWTTNGNNINNTNTGNVGIGTTTPSGKLHIFNAGNLIFNLQSGSAAAEADFISGGGGSWALGTGWASAGMSNFYFYDNNASATRMVLDGSGRVGIGTTSPTKTLVVQNDTADNQLSIVRPTTNAATLNIGIDNTGPFLESVTANKPLSFYTNNGSAVGERMRIDKDGNVGIGTTTPQAALDVQGNINASGSINAKYQDVAEWVPSQQKLTGGTVVILDPDKSNQVIASSESYDTRVAGVVSDNPGVILGEGGEGKVKVATTGRVRVKVDASRGAIKIGDLLVTSDIEGVAMKSVPVNVGGVMFNRPGTLIGKALEPLEKGKGEILVLLSLQ